MIRNLSLRRRSVVALGLALVVAQASAQMPRPDSSYLGTAGLRDWARNAKFTRVITVDSGGKGDFSTINAGLAAATALSPTLAIYDRALVAVYLGSHSTGKCSYTEAAISVPDYVSLVGIVSGSAAAGAFTGHVGLCLTGTSGSLVGVGNESQIVHFDLSLAASPTAATTMVRIAGSSTASLIDVNVLAGATITNLFGLDLVNCVSGGLVLDNVGLWRFGTATLTRHIVSACSSGVKQYSGRLKPGTSQAVLVETTGSGVIQLSNTQIDSGATCDLKPAGALSIENRNSTLETVCGTGTVLNAPDYLQLISAPSGSCAPGRNGYDADNYYLCVGGEWHRIPHSPLVDLP